MNKITYMALAGIACCAVASAAPIPVVNGDFANPTAKVTDGYASVLGWSNTGTTYGDTGVEAAPGGEVAFAKSSDDGGYQILSYAMVAGEQYNLTWDSSSGASGAAETVTLLSATATSDAFAATAELASYAGALLPAQSLSYTATAADAGKYLGISFDNTSGGNTWIDWDNFAVEAFDPSPTPAAPDWHEDPVFGDDVTVGLNYDSTIAGKASDPNFDTVIYSIVAGSGPTWLTLNSDGTMTGVAPATSGTNTWTVNASDGVLSANAELKIFVKATPDPTSVIGWNFTSNWGGPTIQGDGTVDGFDQWTDSVDEANTSENTKVPNSTDAGAVTTPINAAMVSVAWTSSGMWNAGDEANPDQGLYRVYLDDGGVGPTVSVFGLSAWLATVPGATGYQLRFYRSTDNAPSGNFAAVSIYGGSSITDPLLETLPVTAAAGDGSYPAGTGGEGARLAQDAAGTFTADTITFNSIRDGDDRAAIAGFKITATFDRALPVTDLVITGPFAGDMELSWTGKAYGTYGVQTNIDLVTGSWGTLMTGIPGIGGPMATKVPAGPEKLFYKIITE